MQDEIDNSKHKAAAFRVLAVEFLVTLVAAALLLITAGSVAAYSAALGGVAFILPNALFARYAFRHSAAASADLAMRWFYAGEAIKIVVTVLIFAACFTLIQPLSIGALFGVYLGMMLINLIGVSRIAV